MTSAAGPSQQVDLAALDTTQAKTFRDFLANYNRVSEKCFRACIWDFTSRNVSGQEDRCTSACVEKYLKCNQRVNTRFQEMQMLAQEHLAQLK